MKVEDTAFNLEPCAADKALAGKQLGATQAFYQSDYGWVANSDRAHGLLIVVADQYGSRFDKVMRDSLYREV